MMRIEVLYFAGVRDLMGRPRDEIELPADVRSVVELLRHLETENPRLSGRLASVRVAVNEEFRSNEHELSDGDVVALIPPVAGG